MTQYPETDRVRTVTERTYTWYGMTISHATLRRITGLIQLAFVILNALIGLRFLLKLMAANPANPFAQLIYFITDPFLWIFQGITFTPTLGGIQIEFFSLIAIVVYTLIAWILTQLIWLLFSRLP
jgi:YggT family protein